MATNKAQRVGIWAIAIIMLVGTLAGFVAIILAPANQQTDQSKITRLTEEYQAAVAAQGAKLSETYYEKFSAFNSRVAAYDKSQVTELKTEDLVVGDGEVVTSADSFTAYYIGWNPDGVVFDGSIQAGSLKAPFTAQPGGVITGWTEGVDGMKIGGVREITIPADKAYGATGSGENIGPNTPIKFVMMVIPTPAQVDIPAELQKYYSNRGSY